MTAPYKPKRLPYVIPEERCPRCGGEYHEWRYRDSSVLICQTEDCKAPNLYRVAVTEEQA